MHLREENLKRIPSFDMLGADPEPPGHRFAVLCPASRLPAPRRVIRTDEHRAARRPA